MKITRASPFPWSGVEVVDPATLEGVADDASPWSGDCIDPLEFADYLPDLEAEVLWLLVEKRKPQADAARLLGLAQATISYHLRRALKKSRYLAALSALDVAALVDDLDFLTATQRRILRDFAFELNQVRVGARYGVGQSSVRWALVKSIRNLEERERGEPGRWLSHLALLRLVDRHRTLRIR